MTEDIFKEKKAFNFYRSYYETSLLLNGDDKLEFMEAILHYQFTGELLEPKSPFALLAFKGQIHSLNKQVIGYVKGKSGTINTQPTVGSPPLTPPRVTPPHPRVQVQEKEEVKEKEKEEIIVTPAAKTFKQFSKTDLSESLKPFLTQYDKTLIRDFYDYWTEPLASGKIRMTSEKAWDINRRLKTWSANNSKFATSEITNQPKRRKL